MLATHVWNPEPWRYDFMKPTRKGPSPIYLESCCQIPLQDLQELIEFQDTGWISNIIEYPQSEKLMASAEAAPDAAAMWLHMSFGA